jgi:electron transfer flavoprotein alpha subunit
MILVIIEHLQGKLNRMSLEALAAATAIGKETNHPVEALLIGSGVSALASEIPAAKLHLVEHTLLEKYTSKNTLPMDIPSR